MSEMNTETRLVMAWMKSCTFRWKSMSRGCTADELARDIEEIFLDDLEKIRRQYGLFGDLLELSLDRVCWNEIAEFWCEEI